MLCEHAQLRHPQSYCEAAHGVILPYYVPDETRLPPGKTGICPDRARHVERYKDFIVPQNLLVGQEIVCTYDEIPSLLQTMTERDQGNGERGPNHQ